LANIPWANVFLPSKILVVGVDDKSNVVAVCGVRSLFNILTLYVCEQCRGLGIGSQILKKTIGMARERRLGFILLGFFMIMCALFVESSIGSLGPSFNFLLFAVG